MDSLVGQPLAGCSRRRGRCEGTPLPPDTLLRQARAVRTLLSYVAITNYKMVLCVTGLLPALCSI